MTMDDGDARQEVRSLPRGLYRLPPMIGERERSDAASRLAAVVAAAGRETAGRHAATPRASVSTGNGSAHDTAGPAAVTPSASPAAPVTPAAWPDADLAALVTCLTTDRVITAGQHPGVTRGRLQQALPAQLKAQARLVLRWLEAAALLAPPRKPDDPYRHPRALRSLDPAVCTAALRATPVPEYGSRPHTQDDG